MKIAYQNVGKGLVATQEVLMWGAQEGVDVVLVGEMWKGEWDGKVHRQSHPSYERVNVSKDGTAECYVRKGVAKGAKPAGKGEGWVRIISKKKFAPGIFGQARCTCARPIKSFPCIFCPVASFLTSASWSAS